MKKIPEGLVREMRRDMEKLHIEREEQVEWFKWLRYHLDFCFKYPHSTREPETEVLYLQKTLPWQFVFPAKTLTLVPESGKKKRYHVHDSHFSKELRHAVWKSGISKKVGAHTLRHTFASHLLLANYDIRTIQDMMGHSDPASLLLPRLDGGEGDGVNNIVHQCAAGEVVYRFV